MSLERDLGSLQRMDAASETLGDPTIKEDPEVALVGNKTIWKYTDGSGNTFYGDRSIKLLDQRGLTEWCDRIESQRKSWEALPPEAQGRAPRSRYPDLRYSQELGELYSQAKTSPKPRRSKKLA